MDEGDKLAGEITERTLRCEDVDVLQDLDIGGSGWRNELLLFIKPEVFLLKDRENVRKTVGIMLDNLKKFEVKIDGVYAVNGRVLGKNNIMSRHYGYINTVSNSASKIVDEETRKRIGEMFSLTGDFDIVGGHEYLQRYPGETVDTLDAEWFREKSLRVRSGFYVRLLKKDGKDVVLVNGFNPKQLSYFTDPTHRIVLMLLHSNASWSDLRNVMVGGTYPEKAVPESIRGILYANAKALGFGEVTIANNCVHLSAGPFEGMFEIVNFFGKIAELDIKKQWPLALRYMLASGIGYEDAIKALDNPKVEKDGKTVDLFTATEDMDTDKAIPVFTGSLGVK